MSYKQADQFVRLFVRLLQDRRKESGLSHERLAALAGIHRSTVSLIETGQRVPSIHICYRLCRALEIPLSEVIERAEKSLR